MFQLKFIKIIIHLNFIPHPTLCNINKDITFGILNTTLSIAISRLTSSNLKTKSKYLKPISQFSAVLKVLHFINEFICLFVFGIWDPFSYIDNLKYILGRYNFIRFL